MSCDLEVAGGVAVIMRKSFPLSSLCVNFLFHLIFVSTFCLVVSPFCITFVSHNFCLKSLPPITTTPFAGISQSSTVSGNKAHIKRSHVVNDSSLIVCYLTGLLQVMKGSHERKRLPIQWCVISYRFGIALQKLWVPTQQLGGSGRGPWILVSAQTQGLMQPRNSEFYKFIFYIKSVLVVPSRPSISARAHSLREVLVLQTLS